MIRGIVAGMALLAVVAGASAQSAAPYPSKPIRIIVGYTPGGSNDVVARLVAQRMTESMGQPVVVENRPSTGAIVGAVTAAKSPADGYTLMIGAIGPMVFNQATYSSLPYSPTKDFVPISLVATFPLILSVKADSAINSIPDLVKYTRDNPKQSNYASSAASFQLATELLKESTGIQAEHVPYKGSADSMQGVASGQITFTLLDPGPAAGAIKGNLLRGLAVTSAKRSPAYPNIPTLREQGVDQQIEFWIGMFAPAGTPAAIVKTLESEMAKAVAHPETVRRMGELGLNPESNSSEAFGRQIAREIQTWTAVAKAKNIKAD